MIDGAELKEFGCYRVETTARVLYLMFKGRSGAKLCWANLDPPYENVSLKPRHIVSITPIGAKR